jgi:hypothetical protein
MQLADFGLKLFEIFKRLQGYPTRLQANIDQIEQLIVISHTISGNPGLHTPAVHSRLNSTLVVAAELKAALERMAGYKSARRYWKLGANGALQERQIEAMFRRLEEEKTRLGLSICFIHIDTLVDIQRSVDLLVGNWSKRIM